MQGTILIVDAISTNRIVLKVKLSSAYYKVDQRADFTAALAYARATPPDLIVTALDLPGGSAAQLCTALRRHPTTRDIPVLVIGADPDDAIRLETLAAGAADIMSRPINDELLLGRVRSLIRDHTAMVEWHLRDDKGRSIGLGEPAAAFDSAGHFVFVGRDAAELHSLAARLGDELRARITLSHPSDAMTAGPDGARPDVYLLSLTGSRKDQMDALRLITALRASATGRHVGIIVLQDMLDAEIAAHALDLGADDLMTDRSQLSELALRLKSLLKRKRQGEQLRDNVRTGLRAAVFDPLTGLHNRRYAMPQLAIIAKQARALQRPFAVMVADLDHFKQINDAYGHAAGDKVLVEVAQRLRRVLRGADMIARIGGEEFLIVLPGTTPQSASAVASCLCDAVAATPFDLPGGRDQITVTISIGMAAGDTESTGATHAAPSEETLLAEADRALYRAKLRGRNQVTCHHPAA